MERPAPRLLSFRLSPILLARHRLPRARHGTLVQVVLYLGSCIETLYRPNRSPFSEITPLASSTAVFSVLPLPKRMPRSSALERASGPSESRRSRGLSSGGSCFMVYRRPIHSHSITEQRYPVPVDPKSFTIPNTRTSGGLIASVRSQGCACPDLCESGEATPPLPVRGRCTPA